MLCKEITLYRIGTYNIIGERHEIIFGQCMLKYQWYKHRDYLIKFYIFLPLFQITSFWYQD